MIFALCCLILAKPIVTKKTAHASGNPDSSAFAEVASAAPRKDVPISKSNVNLSFSAPSNAVEQRAHIQLFNEVLQR